jgi:outer membrane protein assembly factor BamD
MGHEAKSYNSACHPTTKESNLVIFRTAALSNRLAKRSSLLRAALALSVVLTVAGCSGTETKYDKTAGWSAEQLYADAKMEMDAGAWNDARERLTAIESRYPFGIYAQQALIDLAYVNWKDNENEQALATIARFQQMYPNHPGTDYILYLKGLINFTPASAFMSNLTGQDPAERDPKGLRASYDAFNELIKRFPDSKYTPDAEKRITWLVNAIAMNEVYVARYYYERAAYVAAANRAQSVITDFEGAPASEEALVIMMSSYDKLGMTDLRDDAQRVLKANFPNSTMTAGSLSEKRSWWNPF